ncbi:AmmeMemoRadiSam system protein B, partial [Methanosarcinales archaeon]
MPANKPKKVLTSSLAGRWYASDPKLLQAELNRYYQKAKSKTKENIIALILPHAGYQYSGATAMEGLKALGKKKFQRVVILGPSHSLPMWDTLSVPDATHYKTPLGETTLDLQFMERLKEYSLFHSIPMAHQYEHSVQIEVPLIQYLNPDFELVPIIAGSLRLETVLRAGAILRSLIDENTLVIASSDFTHYGPRFQYEPYKNQNDIPGKVKALDMGAYEFIDKRDARGFLTYREKTGCTICGFMPVAILLSMLPENSQAHLDLYYTSGDLTGDWNTYV